MSEGVEILEEAVVVKKDASKKQSPEEVTSEAKAEAEVPAKEVKKSKKEATPKKKASQRFQSLAKKVDAKAYPLEEAVKLVKANATAKFDETIEAHFRLGIDASQTAQNVRGSVQLPHGTGKKVRVLVFASGADAAAAEKAGATVATEETVTQIEKGSIPFDLVLAAPSEMPKIAKLARVLGVRGLMPNPRAGTVTADITGTIDARKGGLIDFKNDNALLHLNLGKASFTEKQLEENFLATLTAIKAARPAKVSGEFIKSAFLVSTMGPAVKLDLSPLH